MQNKPHFVLGHTFPHTFLYAEVGTESNGTPLTILSVLARLGKDPWEAAENLIMLPDAKAVDCLVRDLLEMPIYSAKPCEARIAASQALSLLRFSRRKKADASSSLSAKAAAALILCILAAGLGCNILLMTKVPAEILNGNTNYLGGW